VKTSSTQKTFLSESTETDRGRALYSLDKPAIGTHESPWFGQGHDPCPDNLQHRGEDGQHSLHSDSADPTKSTANSTSRPLFSPFFSQPTAAPQPAFSQPSTSLQPSLSQPTAANIVYRGQFCQATAFAYMLQYQKILEV